MSHGFSTEGRSVGKQPAFHQYRDVYPVAASPMPFTSSVHPLRVSLPLSSSLVDQSLSESDGSYAYPSLVQSMSSPADRSSGSSEQFSLGNSLHQSCRGVPFNAEFSKPENPVSVRNRRITNNERIFGYNVPSPIMQPKRTKVVAPGEYFVSSPMQSSYCRAAAVASSECVAISPMPPPLTRANVAASSDYCGMQRSMPPWRARVAAPSECGDESVRDSTFSTVDESSIDDGSSDSTDDDDDSVIEASTISDAVIQKDSFGQDEAQRSTGESNVSDTKLKMDKTTLDVQNVLSNSNNLSGELHATEGDPLPCDVLNSSQAIPSGSDALFTTDGFLDPFVDDLLSLNKTTFDMYLPKSVLSTFKSDRSMNDTIATEQLNDSFFDHDIFDALSDEDEPLVDKDARGLETNENDARTNVADAGIIASKDSQSSDLINITTIQIPVPASLPAEEHKEGHVMAQSLIDSRKEGPSLTYNGGKPESADGNTHLSPAVPDVDCITESSEDTHQKKKSKRSRTAFSAEQLIYLEEYFKKKPYLERTPRATLSIALNLSERQIKIWFQNRRMRAKNDRQSNKSNEGLVTEADAEQDVESSPQGTVPVSQDSRSLNRVAVSTPMGVHSNLGAIQNAQLMNGQANYVSTGQQFVPNRPPQQWQNNDYLTQMRQGTYRSTFVPTTDRSQYTVVGHSNNSYFPPGHPSGLQSNYYGQSQWMAAPTANNPAAEGAQGLVANQAYWPQYRK